jgi:hypothetical protein
MAKSAISEMDFRNNRIKRDPEFVTAQAVGRSTDNMTQRLVIIIAVNRQQLIRMTVNTDRRVCREVDCINHFLPWAVMAGGARTRTVGGHIVLGFIDLGPG